MTRFYFYLLAGYLSGSVLYAHIWGRFLCRKDVTAGTRDKNPGTATLLCDLAKGFVPVWLFLRQTDSTDFALAFVLAAPVIGHIFPLFHHFRGGKGIATSFGCLLGLYPSLACALILAGCFIVFSTVLVISPHYYRTLAAYLAALIITFLTVKISAIRLGMLLISGAVSCKLLTCDEKNERLKVKLL